EKNKEGHFLTAEYPEKLPFSCPLAFGGNNKPSPEDLFIVSIAACTLTTILHLCDSLHTEPKTLRVTTSADIQFNEHLNSYEFSSIDCTIIITGDEFLLKRACELVSKYCLVGKSIIPTINYTFSINP
ncbi:MAG: OsmC family protein, partial [Candidatus Hodarchaeales archaeon]